MSFPTASGLDRSGTRSERHVTNILGIETSCDETAAAVVADGVRVRSSIVASQVNLHAKYGGVVPEIASRAHIERLDSVIEEAIHSAGMNWPSAAALLQQPVESAGAFATDADSTQAVATRLDRGLPNEIDAIAVTNRPGLVGALIIGVTAAKALAWAWGRPLIGVDHIRAHAYSPAIGLEAPPWPAVGLIVSGGHTSLFRINSPTQIELLGATTDDAAGEAFDKVSTVLGLPYPGGPAIEKLARDGDPRAVDFPRTMLGQDSLDFSFSGIKTAVLYHVHGPGRTSGGLEKLSRQQLADIAASFQQAVVDVLVRKTMLAVDRTGLKTVVLGGGVAANRALRTALENECHQRRLGFFAAPMAYCTDNAAMIAALGYHLLGAGWVSTLELDAYAGAS